MLLLRWHRPLPFIPSRLFEGRIESTLKSFNLSTADFAGALDKGSKQDETVQSFIEMLLAIEDFEQVLLLRPARSPSVLRERAQARESSTRARTHTRTEIPSKGERGREGRCCRHHGYKVTVACTVLQYDEAGRDRKGMRSFVCKQSTSTSSFPPPPSPPPPLPPSID